MAGLIRYGAYIPHNRLARSKIAAALGEGGGKGTRAVASYDEDPTSMAVEAARPVLRGLPSDAWPQRLLVATANPPYLDKTNANVVHAALRLDPSVLAVDVNGSVRSGVGALLLAAESDVATMAVLTDVRTGLPTSADERDGGDASAAFLFGPGTPDAPVIAEVVAHASATGEFLDRWRLPGAASSRVWEERFGEHAYGPLADAAFTDGLKAAGLTPGEIDVLVVAGTHSRAVRVFAGSAGVAKVAGTLATEIGNPGTAQPGVLLADVLDRAEPGQTIALVVLADGATSVVLRTTEAIASGRSLPTVSAQVAAGDATLAYAQFLTWRGHLTKEPPRRPDPVGPAAPPSLRSSLYKYGFVGTRCLDCGTVHLPAVRVCIHCKSVDRTEPVPMADAVGTVATFTIDRLAYSPSPPVVAVVVDFDGGGRFSCELTDAGPDSVRIGDRVGMTFRKIVTAGGIHNYFWKARPLAAAASTTAPASTTSDAAASDAAASDATTSDAAASDKGEG